MGDKKYNNYRVLHRTFIINLRYDQSGVASFVKSHAESLQITLPFIKGEISRPKLGAISEVSE